MALLEVDGLSVSFRTDDGVVRAVQDLSFSVDAGKTLGIVGESGSGKSVSTQTIMGLTRGAQITGRALFEGRDLLTMSDSDLQKLRGNEIAMIFQDPLSSLHPHYTVGKQIEEVVRAHTDQSRKQARALAIDLLGRVGIPEPHRRVDDRPHQFSGGMRQRAMIAMALTLNPKLIIADEPTTALDVTVQAQILDLLAGLRNDYNAALVMITHDLGVIAEIADDVMIMYAGKSIEFADRHTAYYQPHHPYTKGLIESIPSYGGARERLRGRSRSKRIRAHSPYPGRCHCVVRPSGARDKPEGYGPVRLRGYEAARHHAPAAHQFHPERLHQPGENEGRLGQRELHAHANAGAGAEWHVGEPLRRLGAWGEAARVEPVRVGPVGPVTVQHPG